MVAASLSVGSTALIVRPCFSLSSTQPAEVAELGVVEVRLGEPAIDARRDAAPELGGAIGRLERLGLLGALLEGLRG